MRLEFHPEAELELIEAAVHYEVQVPGLGGASNLKFDVRRIFCSSIPRSVIRLIPICAGSF
jgi:hypothetical protein